MTALSRRRFLATAATSGALLGYATLLPREALAFLAGSVDSKADAWKEYLSKSTNPYILGNHAPVQDEVTVDALEILGELPRAIDGMYVRNGTNPQFPPKGRYHWFDGDGMLHGVHLREGRASYRNRYVRTFGYEMEKVAGEAVWTGLTEMPNLQSPPHGRMFKNTANTALVWHAGRLFALQEGGKPHEIALPSLDTVGEYDYDGKLHHPFTAHPKIDAATQEMMFFGYQPMGPEFLQYSVASKEGALVRTSAIELPRGVMMHDFAITEKHTIFMDLPLVFNPMRMAQGLAPFFFDKEQPSRFGILPRHGTNADIRWFEAPPCYVFHNLNAWEEQGPNGTEVVLVGCRIEETTVAMVPPGHSTQDAGHSSARGGQSSGSGASEQGHLHRWRFDLTTGRVSEEALDDRPSDFPRLRMDQAGRKNRYGYTASLVPDDGVRGPLFEGILKYDLEKGATVAHLHGRERYGGEPVFVPRQGSSVEDDGWLVTFVHDHLEERSELVVVDAQNLDQPPVARVLMPQRVPYGFHGEWVDGRELA
jgi:carotenoid cleavage dioxygenase